SDPGGIVRTTTASTAESSTSVPPTLDLPLSTCAESRSNGNAVTRCPRSRPARSRSQRYQLLGWERITMCKGRHLLVSQVLHERVGKVLVDQEMIDERLIDSFDDNVGFRPADRQDD